MNATIRGLKGFLALGALACLGLLLRWVTAGSITAATTQDLTAMASLAIGAVAWVAYCWLVLAVLATVLEQTPGAIGRAASLVATGITSHGSRALLRSALGVAAVTPLTIGLAQATPGQPPNHPHTNTTNPHQHQSSPTRPWTSTEPRSTVDLTSTTPPAHRTTPVDSRSTVDLTTPTPTDHRSLTPTPGGPSTGARPWNTTEPRSSIDLASTAATADGTPSVESRSPIDLASTAATATRSAPAEPRPTADHTSTASTAHRTAPAEPRSTVDLTSAPPARHSASSEPRTAATRAGGSQLSISAKPGPASARSGATGRPADEAQAGARPWSAVEPRSTVEVAGSSTVEAAGRSTVEAAGRSSNDWRATEAPSSVQLTEQSGSTPSTASRTPRTPQPQTSDQAKTANRTSTTGTPAQRPHQQTRTGAPTAKQPPAKHTAVPEQPPAAVPEQSAREHSAVPERVVVPDRPTAGAPTRYTHLQSGQVARPWSRVVKPGDSLWTIAAAELGPAASDDAIAARWPQWYAANRQLIGPDPNVIHPGQVLNPPPPGHPVPPTNQEK
ncbi:hypothetical protein [Kribbella sp. NPDC023855]|uniref:hypothetical protein n=1 Tax=Kribbella sp. NPDC023855 TaxID=3154698 RepID=UPI003402726E